MQTEKAKSSQFDRTRGFKNQIFPTLAIQLIACSQMNSVMVQKTMIAKNSARARKQPFLFSKIPQTVANCLIKHMKMKMILNIMAIVEKEKVRYSITINATPISCQEI